MMKATGLKRGSRKKQDAAKEEQRQVPHAPASARQQNHPDVMQHKRKQTDEVATLTTKNYRLAKELAELRVRHRDETKNVTRLTMENMNLASRCREAISHVAMLKKELALQQKRTAEALASQREQTQRMADSLTSSMELSRVSRTSSEEYEDKDVNLTRLISATPSPVRAIAPESPASSEKLSFVRSPSPLEEARESPPPDPAVSPILGKAQASRITKQEFFTDMEDDDTVADTVGNSTGSISADVGAEEASTSQRKKIKDEKLPIMYSTPKRSAERWAPKFHDAGADERDRNEGGLFPFSASPQTFAPHSSTIRAVYNEEFPSDIIDKPSWARPIASRYDGTPEIDDFDEEEEDELSGPMIRNESFSQSSVTPVTRKVNLISNIDAFEKSFTTDFPESFTPKDITSNLDQKERKVEIYNPFFPTPERLSGGIRSPLSENLNAQNDHGSPRGRRKSSIDSLLYSTAEEKKTDEPSEHLYSGIKNEFETPPKGGKSIVLGVDPGRPEKTMSAAARARYEKALQPRNNSGSLRKLGESKKNLNLAPINSTSPSTDSKASGSSEIGSASALLMRIQQKRMNKRGQNSPESSERESHPDREESAPQSIVNIVDEYEGTSGDEEASPTNIRFQVETVSSVTHASKNGVHQAISARLHAFKNSRRSVQQPLSYAEPALNTKLRRGDTYFPKSGSPSKQAVTITPVVSPGDTAAH